MLGTTLLIHCFKKPPLFLETFFTVLAFTDACFPVAKVQSMFRRTGLPPVDPQDKALYAIPSYFIIPLKATLAYRVRNFRTSAGSHLLSCFERERKVCDYLPDASSRFPKKVWHKHRHLPALASFTCDFSSPTLCYVSVG